MRLETDKIIFALGGIILGFGILEILNNIGTRFAYQSESVPLKQLNTFIGSPGAPKCPKGRVLRNRYFCPPGQRFSSGVCVSGGGTTSVSPPNRPSGNKNSGGNSKSSCESSYLYAIAL